MYICNYKNCIYTEKPYIYSTRCKFSSSSIEDYKNNIRPLCLGGLDVKIEDLKKE